jgi:hypothetical protein
MRITRFQKEKGYEDPQMDSQFVRLRILQIGTRNLPWTCNCWVARLLLQEEYKDRKRIKRYTSIGLVTD